MNNEAKNNFAKLNQSLYFARLQIDAAELLQDKTQSVAFSQQQIQSCNQSAIDHLYRAVYFLSCFVIEPPVLIAQLQQNPMELKQPIEAALLELADPALLNLNAALQSGGTLFGLLESYYSQWRPEANSRQSLSLLASDKTVTAQTCRDWHTAISAFAEAAVESKIEY